MKIISVKIAVFFLLTGIMVLFVERPFTKYLTDTMLVFEKNSATYNSWVVTPSVPLDIYLFNWTNPHEIHNHSTKPHFEEVGPYRFLQKITRENVTWNNNKTVTYRQRMLYHFDEKSKKRNLSDRITTINAVAVIAAYKARFWNYAIKRALSLTLRTISADINITKTAGELLFDGYDDPLLSMANNFPFLSHEGRPILDKFAWFRIKNNSVYLDGVMNMGTANDNFGELVNWNYKTHTDFYEGDCGKVQGSSGQFYKRPITKDTAMLFCPDICSYIQFDFEGEVYVKNILGHKYVFGESALDNGTKMGGNSCFCTGECVPSGMKNITNCRFGTPSFISLPSFYKADPYYVNSLEGLKPNKKLHDSYIIFEPNTGVPLEVNIALQINMILQPIEPIGLFEKVPKIFFPCMWFKQSFTIPDNLATNLNLLLKVPSVITFIASLVISIAIILGVCYLHEIFIKSDNKKRNLTSNGKDKDESVPLQSTK